MPTERIEKTVFISYRRTNVPWALAIFQNLQSHGFDVFFDYNGIASGDFEQVILGNIAARAHFLVILTPSALEKCGDPKDWLRREIEAALEYKRNIVPLMLEGFSFRTMADQLTDTLADLEDYNGLSVPAEYFLEAMTRLRERFLSVPLTAVLHPNTRTAQRAVTEQKAAAEAAPPVQEEELTAQQWFERAYASVTAEEQIRFYSEAIRLNPSYAEAFNNRGIARGEKGDLEGESGDYDEAIRLKPDYADAFYNRGIARRRKGDMEGAISDYDEAIRLKPDYVDAFYNRGIARRRKGDLEGAIADYGEAIRLKPDNAVAFNNRGTARGIMGDLEGAIVDFNEAIRLEPDDADAFCNRGIARNDNGDPEGAIADYDEAIRRKPDYANAFHNRANARRAIGDIDGALRDEEEVARLGYKAQE
jgi:tetratricopeptide (TPR) repeat protein